MVRILTLFLIASLTLLGAAGPAQSAKRPPKLPKIPKTTAYWANIEITYTITINTLYDSLTACNPGQAWRLTETAGVDLRGKTVIGITRGRVGTGVIRNKRTAVQGSNLGGYRTTNWCDFPPQKLVKPDCRPQIVGNAQAFIHSFPTQKRRVILSIRRTTGANQDSTCRSIPVDEDALYASIHALQHKYRTVNIPLKIEPVGFRNMKPGWKHHTVVNVRGACEDAKITTPESGWVTKQTEAAESCNVNAQARVTITRLKPKKPKAKKAKAKAKKKAKPKKAG